MKPVSLPFRSVVAVAMLCLAGLARGGDVAIGNVEINGMDVGAVYIQPVTMAPVMPGMGGDADIHLEADIQALADNVHGFSEGDWVPYLDITYTITKPGSDFSVTGSLMPMIANDGPHYANNIKLSGGGKYHLVYHIKPPPYHAFHRHTDKETGVPEWWEPFDLEWDFVFVGVGKKGGY